jgi:3'-phosphoadenosine 5'-phosphosulfate sulfotransferase (PAPS reductase)/FAD synthetase
MSVSLFTAITMTKVAMQWQSNMTNPYKLPKGNVLISLSGGRTSAYMLHQILVANDGLRDDVVVAFANTGREMPETLDFVNEISSRWNVAITWLEYTDQKPLFEVVNHNSASKFGEPFEKLIRKNKYIPNTLRRKCTQELKVLTIKRYLSSIGWKKWTNTIGIRSDEFRRVKESKDNRWVNWFPLVDDNKTKFDVADFWLKQSQAFDLQLPIINGVTVYSNCDGCFLKSELKLAEMWRDHPEKMEWWSGLEQEFGHTFRYDGVSYQDIKNNLDKQGDFVFDIEGFFCQADDGECTG